MNDNIFNTLIKKYQLNNKDRNYIKKIINPIYSHPEFQRRMTNEFFHHSDITLGEHLLEDTIMTYILVNKYFKRQEVNLPIALKIAMMHDLYTMPWQNNKIAQVDSFFNKHGFRHPIEAVVNAINWFPEMFYEKDDAQVIIDGIIHHMFPLPVRAIRNDNIAKLELKNDTLFSSLSSEYKKMIVDSLKRKQIGPISFCQSKYPEGRIMSKADKKVSLKEIKNFASAKALLTGKNKKIEYLHK